MVDPVPPAVIGEVAATVDCAAETVPAFTTTVAVWVTATALMVADTVFDSAAVELNVPVATPLALVVPTGCVRVLPVPVAASTTVAPAIGLPFASLAVTVMVDVPLPAVIGDVAATVDCAAETVPAFTPTVAVWVIATVLIVADTVFDSATVELKLPVATPLALVVPTGWVRVFPVPVAASTTVAPAIGLPLASFAVTVTVDAPLPAVIGDVATTVDCAAETVPAVTTTVAVWVIATVLIVAETVFDSATVELKLPVATPLALVVPTGCVRVFPVPVAASTTVAPAIGLPLASFAVTVTVDAPLPAVIGDVATTVDCAAETVPAVTTTVAVWVIATVLIVADTVFDSATVELRLPVATPLALVVPTGWVRVFPVPVAASTTAAPAIGLPFASLAVTVMVDVPLPAVIGDVAATADKDADTAPAVTVTVAVWVIATVLIVAETVFDSATVDASVPVATPLALVVPTGCVRVFPVPVAASTTVAPAIGLPFASLAVTVMVDVPLPAVIGDVAATVDCAAETVPAFTTTVAVWVIATVLIVADTVFDSATVELKLPVATPLALVVPTGWVRVFPVPVAASTTAAPAIGLPFASLAVTVMVDVPLPAVMGDVAATVDCAAETVPAFTTTVAVWVIATVLIVADTVFDSATVDASVPVATPLALVVPTGWVRVFPVPVAASTTVAPAIGLPLASFAVTVTVDAPLPAVIGDVAVTVDCAAETVPAVTTTVAVWVIAIVLIVAETVFDSATVELKLPVATPLALVVPTGCVRVFPVPVATSTTVAPAIGLPLASFAVTVTVDAPLPAVIGDVAVTVDCAAETVPAVTTTVAVWVIAIVLIVAETVFDSATVELKLPVATPLALVVPTGCVRVFPVPVATSTTVAPAIGLPLASFAVTVTVDAPLPAVIGDVATTVDCAAETVPAVTLKVLDVAPDRGVLDAASV